MNKEKLIQLFALVWLLILGALALVGPYGMLAWGEQSAVLEKREGRIAELEADQRDLENKVELLDPENVDADLASELVRENLNVAHPDEFVIELDENP